MKKSSTSFRCSSLLFVFFIVAASINVVYSEDATSIVVDSEDGGICKYRLIVQTGTVAEAGTNSIISVTLGNSAGKRLDIQNLKDSGTMLPPSYDYFEKGNADSFLLISHCFDTPVCNITVTSDGSGKKHGWFLEYVEVSTFSIASVSTVINFEFNKWLANDEPPYKLTASRNWC